MGRFRNNAGIIGVEIGIIIFIQSMCTCTQHHSRHFACYINNLLVLVLMAASSGTSSSVDPVWSLIRMTLTPPTSKWGHR